MEWKSAANIYKILLNIYAEGSSKVKRWINKVNGNPKAEGETDFSDRHNSGRIATAVKEDYPEQGMFPLQLTGELPIWYCCLFKSEKNYYCNVLWKSFSRP